jgi:hypothetical protein
MESHKTSPNLFKSGQLGNPARKESGTLGRKMKVMGILDRILGKEENIALLESALEDTLCQKPVWFFEKIIMPLLPKESRGVIEGGENRIEWHSLVSTEGAAEKEVKQ